EGAIRQAGLAPEERIHAAAQLRLSKVSETLVRAVQDFAPSGLRDGIVWIESLAKRRDDDLTSIIQIAVTLRSDLVGNRSHPLAVQAAAFAGIVGRVRLA